VNHWNSAPYGCDKEHCGLDRPRCPKCNYRFVNALGDVCGVCKTSACQGCGKQVSKLVYDRPTKSYLCPYCYQDLHPHDVCFYCGEYKELTERGICLTCEEKYMV
jgi:hypothetical protein